MVSKFNGPGLYEFLIEAELQQYYNSFRNDLKIQNVAQLKYVSDDDLYQIGMSRPEIRRLTKYFQKHCPQTYLGKMKKKLLFKKDDSAIASSMFVGSQSLPNRNSRSIAPGRHIIQADSIVVHKTLGSGEFGTVQQGVWTNDDGSPIQVAIKSLSQDRMENNPVEFLKEAAIMHTVDHESIVRLHGVVLDTAALMLVTELAPLRSLLECLKEPSMRQNLTVPTLFDFAVQICDGMQYLESKRLIHRDLAARNILVFSRNKVKISDFGLSRALGVGKDYYQTNFNVNLKLPIAWCAPECINFLRFTSASDVWSFGVCLFEMFSYGFQPWAALTGQQILEAIDEPQFQRLEKPECCPSEVYNQIMLKCWKHDALARPTFVQLSQLLPECKPEQVQTLRESETRSRRDLLIYDAADIITVLDKKPSHGNDELMLWKGVLKCGKSGLFNPANTVTYLGSSFPSVNLHSQTPFHRSDSRSSSMKKGRHLSADMISVPQGDLKHTGHMGSDGQFFGDIAFLSSKCWVPRQVVSPYKPEPSSTDLSGHCGHSQLAGGAKSLGDSNSEIHSSDTAPLLCVGGQTNFGDHFQTRKQRRLQLMAPLGAVGIDHEYHEISDEENDIMRTSSKSENVGLSNPALSTRSQSPLDSPGFDKSFHLGPSLVDEVFDALQTEKDHFDETRSSKTEMREMSRHKKKFATVKPISSSDRRTLDQAIAIANELATRSMLDLDRPGKYSNTNNSLDDISSPRTPTTPTHRRKFSFILGSNKGNEKDRRNYSQEAASIPDIQSTLTEEAKEAYNSLVEKPSLGSLGFLTPTFDDKREFSFPENISSSSRKSDFFDNEPQSPPSSAFVTTSISSNNPRPKHLPNTNTQNMNSKTEVEDEMDEMEEETDGNPLRLLRMNKQTNVLPLPPREKAKSTHPHFPPFSSSRHQRKHPLLIPGRIPNPACITREPPPPPPKPQRQRVLTASVPMPETLNDTEISNSSHGNISGLEMIRKSEEQLKPISFENRNSASLQIFEFSEPLYENFETESLTDCASVSVSTQDFSYSVSSQSKNMNDTNAGSASRDSLNSISCNKLVGDSEHRRMFNARNSSDLEGKRLNPEKNRGTDHQENKCSDSQIFPSSLPQTSVDQDKWTPDCTDYPWGQMKMKAVHRILGSSNTEEECMWSLEVTNGDSARAVKLLRLKALLPDELLTSDINRIISVLEMSHWDVAHASDFLLKNSAEISSRKPLLRSDILNSNHVRSYSCGESKNNTSVASTSEPDLNTTTVQDYVVPTQV